MNETQPSTNGSPHDPVDDPGSLGAGSIRAESVRPGGTETRRPAARGERRGSAIVVGEAIVDRFVIREPIGRGAFGETWAATDRHDNTEVVVKFLHLEVAEDWESVDEFKREALNLERLDHPNIPRYVDAFDDDVHGYVLVQQRAMGLTLARRIAAGERFSEERIKTIARQLLGALAYIHTSEEPLIHRDLKPENVIIDGEDHAKLVDFGAACAARSSEDVARFDDSVAGTFGYIPPEQFQARVVPASDLYSLGMTLVHALTGTPPDLLPSERMIVRFESRVQLSGGLTRWLRAMIAPSLKQRFADAQEAVDALDGAWPARLAPTPRKQRVQRHFSALLPDSSDDLQIIEKDGFLELVDIRGDSEKAAEEKLATDSLRLFGGAFYAGFTLFAEIGAAASLVLLSLGALFVIPQTVLARAGYYRNRAHRTAGIPPAIRSLTGCFDAQRIAPPCSGLREGGPTW